MIDGACGTGGMLTVAQQRLLSLAEEKGKDEIAIELYGQESAAEIYAVCAADMLMKGDGEQAKNIKFGSTLSNDGYAKEKFDFMLSNPPYGKSWKVDEENMGGKKGIHDSRFIAKAANGEPMEMLPRSSDGQLLFLLNNLSKMKDTELGSRIAEVHNGSSIFTGDAGSGESNARRYMIEHDFVEAIIALPENMFYNTGIGTYIWVLSNRKEERRKGKIQLINATAMKKPLRKNMGRKNCELTREIRDEIVRIFMEMEESEVSRIFPNDEFGYKAVTVERPLRLRIFPERDIPRNAFKKITPEEYEKTREAVLSAAKTAPLDDWAAFAKATKLKKTVLKTIRPYITEKDPAAQAIEGEADAELGDVENVPLLYPGGVEAFMKNEVLTYAPDAYIDEKKTKTGYEISFTKYFYKPAELREIADILADLNVLEKDADGMMAQITEGIL